MANDERRPESETDEIRETRDREAAGATDDGAEAAAEAAEAADAAGDDGVREIVEATQATVSSALDRIRASREILADSLKPIDELLDDIRASDAAGGRGTTRPRGARGHRGDDGTGTAGPDAAPPV